MNKTFFSIISTILRILAIIVLLGALSDHEYGYYQFLRWVVMVVAGVTAYLAYAQEKTSWMGGMIAIAILFNPILPFYLDRETWIILDLMAAILFIISLFTVHQEEEYVDGEGKARNQITEEVENVHIQDNNQNDSYCSQCGEKSIAQDNFCYKCGTKLR